MNIKSVYMMPAVALVCLSAQAKETSLVEINCTQKLVDVDFSNNPAGVEIYPEAHYELTAKAFVFDDGSFYELQGKPYVKQSLFSAPEVLESEGYITLEEVSRSEGALRFTGNPTRGELGIYSLHLSYENVSGEFVASGIEVYDNLGQFRRKESSCTVTPL